MIIYNKYFYLSFNMIECLKNLDKMSCQKDNNKYVCDKLTLNNIDKYELKEYDWYDGILYDRKQANLYYNEKMSYDKLKKYKDIYWCSQDIDDLDIKVGKQYAFYNYYNSNKKDIIEIKEIKESNIDKKSDEKKIEIYAKNNSIEIEVSKIFHLYINDEITIIKIILIVNNIIFYKNINEKNEFYKIDQSNKIYVYDNDFLNEIITISEDTIFVKDNLETNILYEERYVEENYIDLMRTKINNDSILLLNNNYIISLIIKYDIYYNSNIYHEYKNGDVFKVKDLNDKKIKVLEVENNKIQEYLPKDQKDDLFKFHKTYNFTMNSLGKRLYNLIQTNHKITFNKQKINVKLSYKILLTKINKLNRRDFINYVKKNERIIFLKEDFINKIKQDNIYGKIVPIQNGGNILLRYYI